jgi:O-antigen/teichoic acid export membrane protein
MKVLRNTTAYMAASLIPSAMNLLMLPVYTRFLSPTEYGLVAVVTTLISFIAAFMGLQMVNSIARLYFDYEGAERTRYVSSVYLGTLVFNLSLLVLFHCAGSTITKLLFPGVGIAYSPYVVLGLIGLFFTTQINFCNAMFRVQERALYILVGGITYGIFSACFGLYFVVVREAGAAGVLMGQASAAGMHALILFFLVRPQLRLQCSVSMLKVSLRFGLPLIPHVLGGILFMYTDKYVLAFFVPLASIGLYDLAGKLANILRLIVTSFNSAIAPDFMRTSKSDREGTSRRYRLIILRWSVALAFAFLVCALFAEELISLLAPESYKGAHVFVPILLGAYLFRALQGFASNAIIFEKKVKVFPLITLTAGVVNLGLNLWLIPIFGVIAAAWTTLFSYACSFVLSLHFSRRYYPVPYDWRLLTVIFGAMLGCFLVGQGFAPEPLWQGILVKGVICLLFIGSFLAVNFIGLRSEMFLVLSRLGSVKES